MYTVFRSSICENGYVAYHVPDFRSFGTILHKKVTGIDEITGTIIDFVRIVFISDASKNSHTSRLWYLSRGLDDSHRSMYTCQESGFLIGYLTYFIIRELELENDCRINLNLQLYVTHCIL